MGVFTNNPYSNNKAFSMKCYKITISNKNPRKEIGKQPQDKNRPKLKHGTQEGLKDEE